ncbi:hypothetical protein [Devosia nitrariae]|uniref:hypothetical protein n=1 Tax=Devosia nitrariae TaxID=2071872 RepID=UPI0035EBAE41
MNGGFDRLQVGSPVTFVPEDGERGCRPARFGPSILATANEAGPPVATLHGFMSVKPEGVCAMPRHQSRL